MLVKTLIHLPVLQLLTCSGRLPASARVLLLHALAANELRAGKGTNTRHLLPFWKDFRLPGGVTG